MGEQLVALYQMHAMCVAHCTGVFDDNRLIIVITKFDLVRVSQSEDITEETEDPAEEITEDKVKEATCRSVSNACYGARISPDNVIPVPGTWAYHARMLAKVNLQSRNREKLRKIVVKGLEVCDITCGQGEKPSTSLVKLGDHELSAKLEGFSGITNLEARYSLIYIYIYITFPVTTRVVSVSRCSTLISNTISKL